MLQVGHEDKRSQLSRSLRNLLLYRLNTVMVVTPGQLPVVWSTYLCSQVQISTTGHVGYARKRGAIFLLRIRSDLLSSFKLFVGKEIPPRAHTNIDICPNVPSRFA